MLLSDDAPDVTDTSDTIIPANVPVIPVATDTVIGHPKHPIYLPLTTFDGQVAEVLRNTNEQYDPGIRYEDEFWTDILSEQPYGLSNDKPSIEYRENYGLYGLGAARRVPVAPAPLVVTGEEDEPVESSTIFGVVGGSVLAIGVAIALWAWYSGKKK